MKNFRSPFFLASILTIFWIIVDLLLRYVAFDVSSQPFWSQLYAKSIVMSYCSALLYTTLVGFTWGISRALAAVVLILFALMYTVDLTAAFFTVQYFYSYMSRFHLGFVAQDPQYIIDSLTTYPSLIHVVLIAIIFSMFVFVGLAARRKVGTWRPVKALSVMAIAIALYVATFLQIPNDARHFVLLPNVNATHQAYFFAMEKISTEHAEAVVQLGFKAKRPVPATQPLIPEMKTVVLVVNESWGTEHFSLQAQNAGMPLLAKTINRDSENFVVFSSGFTNSTATDVSWPSILTGVGPEESGEKLLTTPLVSNLAAKAGFKTSIFASWRLEWANMRRFLSAGDFNNIEDAVTQSKPIVNDLGTDDMFTAQRIRQFLRDEVAPADRIFLIFASNAMHPPFQEASTEVSIEGGNLNRHEKANRIVDHAMDLVMQGLRETGRYDEALIILTGDHGDGMRQPNAIPRIASFYDYFSRIPLVVKLPKSMNGPLRSSILENKDRNVQNIDIAPTLAHVFGQCVEEKSESLCVQQRGSSLFQKVPEDRTIVAINTNEIRKWVPEGFGLFRNNNRVLFSSLDPHIRAFDVGLDPLQKKNIWESFSEDEKSFYLGFIKNEPQLNRIYSTYGGGS